MRASDLIRKLNKLVSEHGDLEVCTRNHYLHTDCIERIEVEISRVDDIRKYFRLTNEPSRTRISMWAEYDAKFGKEAE